MIERLGRQIIATLLEVIQWVSACHSHNNQNILALILFNYQKKKRKKNNKTWTQIKKLQTSGPLCDSERWSDIWAKRWGNCDLHRHLSFKIM